MCKEVIWCDDYERLMIDKGNLTDEEALVLHLHVKGYSDVAIHFHPEIHISVRTVQRRIAKLKVIYDELCKLYPWLPPREKQKERIERLRREKDVVICDFLDDSFSAENDTHKLIRELKAKIE